MVKRDVATGGDVARPARSVQTATPDETASSTARAAADTGRCQSRSRRPATNVAGVLDVVSNTPSIASRTSPISRRRVCGSFCRHRRTTVRTVAGTSSGSLVTFRSDFITEASVSDTSSPWTGISVLAARIRTLIHQCRVRTARFLHPRLFRSQLPSAAAALEGKPTGALAFRAFLRHRSTLVSFLRPGGLRCTRPRVSLPAPVAPRSSAAYRRTAAGSGALPPAGASSTAHASPTGPRFSPAAAGDS